MVAILPSDVMPVDHQLAAMADAERETIAEAFWRVAEADAELGRALAALPFRPVTAADAVGRARALLRFALTAVDLETMAR